jgi:glyoxylase-like metal-dependent hydrolase (beta-lactamase superfamily II)
VEEVIPGVLHWQARHPNIGVDVSSYLLLDSGTLVDPLLPEGENPEWIGHPVERIVLTVRHHLRSAAGFGVPIFAHREGLHEFEDEDVEVTGYTASDEIAPGVRALEFGRICPDDAVLHIAADGGVLAFGDGLMHYRQLGFPPDQYIGDDPEAIKADIAEGLKPLLDEEFDTLLFAHGVPVAHGGKQMLAEFLDARA